MIKVAILDDYQNVAQEFVDLKKLSGKYEIKIFSEPFNNDEINIIITGIVEIINTPLITCVKFKE